MPYRTALVTGASSGIGLALSRALARRGALVVLAARRADLLEAAASRIVQEGGQARALELDVARCDEAVERIRALDDELGGLDLVVANAGAGAPSGPSPISWESMREPFHTNVCGAAATLTAVAPRMAERRRGHLVGIGSLSSLGALPGAAAYSAPKAGLAMLLDCLRLDLAPAGVAVTHVRLGFVRTGMVEGSPRRLPLLAEPDDVARAIAARLPSRPREIVTPRSLAAALRVLAALPEGLRERLAELSRGAGW